MIIDHPKACSMAEGDHPQLLLQSMDRGNYLSKYLDGSFSGFSARQNALDTVARIGRIG